MYVNFTGQVGYKPRTVMLTNIGIYILRDPDAIRDMHDPDRRQRHCRNHIDEECPPEALCKGGPTIMARFTLEQVRDICYYTMNKQKLTLTVLQPTHFMDNIAKKNNEE